ncbi:transcription initiation factor TFIIIB [Brevibacillus antibioticus]|uniref:Transcription initiation factor TFIIIB n=1 Tax=Brevibacillus antibioticus TaxID=2570228 RepID=A0A4U2Y619_9BACL|nr:transcription initiation factor TFIIIB [Brevibacillus antibioticus]
MENPIEQCPKCGCSEIGKGRQAPQAGVFPLGKIIPISSVIIHRICTNCGYVIESYVENPSKFKG